MSDITTFASDRLLEFADAIHGEIRDELLAKYGDNWIERGVRKHFKQDYFDRIELMLNSPMRVVDMNRSDYELFGLEHLWQIINGNWDCFGKLFQDRQRTEVYLGEIAELRHNLAHRRNHHVVLRGNLVRFVDNCRILLNAIGSDQADRFAALADSLNSGASPWGNPLAGNLPPVDVMYNEFIERPDQLSELSEWLASDRSQIVIQGYGGAGKSALAYKFVREVRDGSLADLIGVNWVSAKRTEFLDGMARERQPDFEDLDGLLAAIYSGLYGPETLPKNLDKSELLKDLGEMPIILVVDDFDTVSEDVDLASFLLYELRNTPTRLIYTSRHRVTGVTNVTVPPFTDTELDQFIALKSGQYGATTSNLAKRRNAIRSVTQGFPLFVDDFIRHAAIIGIEPAMQQWSQRKGDAARVYALRRQVEYLGHSSGEVLMVLSVSDRSLTVVEISEIAGLTDDDAEAGVMELLRWHMVNRDTSDKSETPEYSLNPNTKRLVRQTYGSDYRMGGYATAFKALTGERLPETKKRAIEKVIRETMYLDHRHGFKDALEHLTGSMVGELADAPELFAVLGRLYSKQPENLHVESARQAFKRSDQLGASKTDTYFHWCSMEKDIAESMLDGARNGEISNEAVAQQWQKCERLANRGIERCGPSRSLYYLAGYSSSREAKSRSILGEFTAAEAAYTRSNDWFRLALDAPVMGDSEFPRGAIFRGLVLALEGLGDVEGLRRAFSDWRAQVGTDYYFEMESIRLTPKFGVQLG